MYLLCFDQPFWHAKHYVGMASVSLDARLKLHKMGRSGARLMTAIHKANISFTLTRLWRCETWEEARDLERKLKRRHGSGRFCPRCRQEKPDDDTYLRLGHWPLEVFSKQARPRRPIGLSGDASQFVRRRPLG